MDYKRAQLVAQNFFYYQTIIRPRWALRDFPLLADPKIIESLDLSAKEEPGTIDVDGGPIDADLMNNPLDLARAYIEMGDFKAAEAQLVRVIATGNSGEVREAEQLMRQLPS